MNRDGAKIPPDPPIPMDRLVAAILANASRIRNHRTYPPAAVLYMYGVADPVHLRMASSSSPSAIPPTAGRAHSGRPFHTQSHRSSVLYRTALNASPTARSG